MSYAKRGLNKLLFACYNTYARYEMNNYEIDIERLRRDLIDYFGTAMYNGSPQAQILLSKVENASPNELISIAINNGFDINDYVIGKSLYL